MLIVGSELIGMPVMGLQTGSELARTTRAIIDPGTLRIIAYQLEGPLLDTTEAYLRLEDVREVASIGMVVDSSDEFVSPGDIIKLDELLALQFDVLTMLVKSDKGVKLGHVIDYTLDITSFVIQQLSVKRPLLKSFNDVELLIHRSQIIEINNDAIIVKHEAPVSDHVYASSASSYVNPFRTSETATIDRR